MSELEPHYGAQPYREILFVDESSAHVRVIDANTEEADQMAISDFWSEVFHDHDMMSATLPLRLQRYFERDDSPDKLIVSFPVRESNKPNSVSQMLKACWEDYASMRSILPPVCITHGYGKADRLGLITAVSVGDSMVGVTLEAV